MRASPATNIKFGRIRRCLCLNCLPGGDAVSTTTPAPLLVVKVFDDSIRGRAIFTVLTSKGSYFPQKAAIIIGTASHFSEPLNQTVKLLGR